jgi:hypothetical protein
MSVAFLFKGQQPRLVACIVAERRLFVQPPPATEFLWLVFYYFEMSFSSFRKSDTTLEKERNKFYVSTSQAIPRPSRQRISLKWNRFRP